jgi:hypothetical protein
MQRMRRVYAALGALLSVPIFVGGASGASGPDAKAVGGGQIPGFTPLERFNFALNARGDTVTGGAGMIKFSGDGGSFLQGEVEAYDPGAPGSASAAGRVTEARGAFAACEGEPFFLQVRDDGPPRGGQPLDTIGLVCSGDTIGGTLTHGNIVVDDIG